MHRGAAPGVCEIPAATGNIPTSSGPQETEPIERHAGKGQDSLNPVVLGVSRFGKRAVSTSELFWLTNARVARLVPCFPRSHGKPCVDARRVLNRIIYIHRNGLRWCDTPKEYGPHSRRDLDPSNRGEK